MKPQNLLKLFLCNTKTETTVAEFSLSTEDTGVCVAICPTWRSFSVKVKHTLHDAVKCDGSDQKLCQNQWTLIISRQIHVCVSFAFVPLL